MAPVIKLVLLEDRIWLEAIPGIYSLVATKPVWDLIPEDGRARLIQQTLERLQSGFARS